MPYFQINYRYKRDVELNDENVEIIKNAINRYGHNTDELLELLEEKEVNERVIRALINKKDIDQSVYNERLYLWNFVQIGLLHNKSDELKEFNELLKFKNLSEEYIDHEGDYEGSDRWEYYVFKPKKTRIQKIDKLIEEINDRVDKLEDMGVACSFHLL